MRQRQRRQPQLATARRLEVGIQAVRAADQEGDVLAARAPWFELLRQRHGGEVAAAFVQRQAQRASRQGGLDDVSYTPLDVYKRQKVLWG